MTAENIDPLYQTAVGHHREGRFAEAEGLYRDVLSIQPDHPGALHMLGALAHEAGRHDAAAELIARAIRLQPAAPSYHNNLGLVLTALGRGGEAAAAFHRAVELRPEYADAWKNLGDALHGDGRWEDAAAAYGRAVALRPGDAGISFALGNALFAGGRFGEALAAYDAAVAARPDLGEGHANRGNALLRLGRVDDAVAAYRRALALRPDLPEAHNNLGGAYLAAGRYDDAVAAHRAALALQPDRPETLHNLGAACVKAGRYESAVAAYRRALALQPDYTEARYSLSLLLLQRGEFAEGWAAFESRFDAPELNLPRGDPARLWDGGSLAGRHVLLYGEQGFGDMIQFARYAPLVADRGGVVAVQCPPELARLFAGLRGVERIVNTTDPPPYDVHCSLLSLPGRFGTTVETIPNAVPYLHPPARLVGAWRARLTGEPAGKKVGLVWAGRPEHENDRNRSIPAAALAPLAGVRGVRFYSLQKPAPGRPAAPPTGMDVVDWTADLGDFADTAALVANLDLVIAVDTAVAHLAGALGKPAWVLLPYLPDWRWLLGREDSPWYPTMRLFRQPRPGDWDAPVRRVVAALA